MRAYNIRILIFLTTIIIEYGCASKGAYFNKQVVSLASKYQSNLGFNPSDSGANALNSLSWKQIHAQLDEFEKVFALMPDSIVFAVDNNSNPVVTPIGTNKDWVTSSASVRVADSIYFNKNKQKYIQQKGLITPHVIFLDRVK